MYFYRTPHMARLLYPSLTWKVKDSSKSIYLTFDDGPDPDVSREVIDLLDKFNAKATFFCVGEKVRQHPELYKKLLDKGHSTGNHTFNHLNGRKYGSVEYLLNIEKAAKLIRSRLFRPPYGKITFSQIRKLKGRYKIIMWSVLPGDFDRSLSREQVLDRALRHTRNGSIVVFHDNAKFRDKMLFALEGFLRHFSQQGYDFRALTEEIV